ncbi:MULTISPECIES: tripartite tricarboxylate transporter substrate binding protein [unclassified Achromobacter]|uniref:Bug family tripartite tricarboxylate transporter substrate binding protein n=1 Tax=unclassified Achromobacter TaxID=2626865 RepID=UPI001303C1B1|nr:MULTISPECIES: tripartite tricarboxylate transporter substrate-binding protein [unclassified Achromobacter]
MKLGKKELAALISAGDGASLGARAASLAAPFPERPITIVVGFPPGGGDMLIREIATHMGEDLGQEILLDYRPGAAGNVGAASVARAERDGYTIFLAGRSNIFHRLMYDDVDYDFSFDLTPVGLVAKMPFVVVAGKNTPLSSMNDIIMPASPRHPPGGYTCAYAEIGTTSHLLGGFLQQSVGIRLMSAPYLGVVEALADVIGGRTDLLIFPLPMALPLIRRGNIKALVIMAHQRVAALPDVPAIDEFGLAGADAEGWYALMAPARTPRAIVATLNRALNTALAQPVLKERLECLSYIPAHPPENTPDTLRALIAQETEKWTAVLMDRNINTLH